MISSSWKGVHGVLALAAGLGAAWAFGGPATRGWSVALLLLLLLGGTVHGALVRRRRDPGQAFNWKALAGFGLLGSYNACLHIAQLLHHGTQVPNPPMATLLLWGPALLLLAAAVHAGAPHRPGRKTRLLDGGVFGLAAYLAFWMWVIKPVVATHPLDPLLALGVHTSFIMAFTTLGVAMHGWVEQAAPVNSPIGFIALGTLLLTLALPAWVGMLLSGTFHQGHPIRIAFTPGFLMVYLSTQAPWPTRQAKPNEALRMALPYVPTTIAFVGFLAHYLPKGADRDATALALLGALAILVLIRQALTLRQLLHLNRDLEGTVELRTRELTRSQALLMETQQKNLVATLGAGITHDLNNLLGAAMGNLDLLRLKISPDTGAQEMQGLEKALERAGNLSKSLMGLARTGTGPKQAFDLVAHLNDLHPLLRAMVPRNIELTWEPGSSPLQILANPGQVDQVLVNLISNAKDATPSGGRISLRAHQLGSEAVLEVQDTRTGIPDNVMARLFEPFLTTKPLGKGTGLGLSSVRAVVEHLGGSIQVRTGPQDGTTFTLTLPMAP